jgi:hypothetical protein
MLELDSASGSLSYEDLSHLLRAAARCGLFASVSVTIGISETLDQRMKTLTMVRHLQQETNAIQAVLVRVHHAATPEARREEEATAVDYLKMLAVTRIYADFRNCCGRSHHVRLSSTYRYRQAGTARPDSGPVSQQEIRFSPQRTRTILGYELFTGMTPVTGPNERCI